MTLIERRTAGEQVAQERAGSTERAAAFYADQVTGVLNEKMRAFVTAAAMAWIATANAAGETDCSFRAGPPGFIRILDRRTIAWPEYRGNGVLASVGNMLENPHVGILLIDFAGDQIGLHINGEATVLSPSEMKQLRPETPPPDIPGRTPQLWVVVSIAEAYVHCSKHIPRLVTLPRSRQWGSDDPRDKGGDYFELTSARASSRAVASGHIQSRENGGTGPRTDGMPVVASREGRRGLPWCRSGRDGYQAIDEFRDDDFA